MEILSPEKPKEAERSSDVQIIQNVIGQPGN
jgi:hypothetical protein